MPTPNPSETKPAIASLCRSFADAAELELLDVGGDVASAILREAGGKLDGAAKAKLIEAVRAGQHVELAIRAITFRQRDGSPNKNFLRFKSSKLGEIATSFVGKPALVDHNKWSQSARIGTIEASESVPLAGGWTGFRQTIRVVKPDAVISVLDGTIDRFSIGWDPRGTVLCTVHKVDVRSKASCYWKEDCYPGKTVDVDGSAQVAEYEWQSTEGVETSSVNTPAVSGTKIEEVRSALAFELEIHEPRPHQLDIGEALRMTIINRLGPILGLGDSLTDADADRIVTSVKETAAGKLAAEQERDSALTARDEATKRAELFAAKVAQLEGDKVEAALAAAYKAGKMIRGKDEAGNSTPSPREPRLRRIASEQDGLAALELELAEMPVVVPVGHQVLADEDPNPRPTSGPLDRSVLASTAKQLGIPVEELEAHDQLLRGGSRKEGN